MNLLEGFGTIVGVVGFGFGLGQWLERRRKTDESVVAALQRVRASLQSIEFFDFSVSPIDARMGSELHLQYTVESRLRIGVEVWLGADVLTQPGTYHYDVTQDKEVVLAPGRHTYTRHLTTPMLTGRYWLNVGVWYGQKSVPNQSIALAQRSTEINIVDALH